MTSTSSHAEAGDRAGGGRSEPGRSEPVHNEPGRAEPGRSEPGRIERCFRALRAQHRSALIPYLTAGYPEPGLTVELMHAATKAGADVIELGVPFSDPMADGPVVQRASERALRQGVGLRRVFQFVQQFRQTNADTPVVLMGYCNPIERMGLREFAGQAAAAGVDGVLIVDCPPEESDDYVASLNGAGLDPVFLVAPTTVDGRLDLFARVARGYLYYVSLKGVTGASNIDVDEVVARIEPLRDRMGLPIAVGFGVKDEATAARIAAVADAVVIGSRVIEILEDGEPRDAAARLGQWLRRVRAAMDAATRQHEPDGR